MQSPNSPLLSSTHTVDPPVRRFGMLSTFPPTECGIATFAAALSAGIIASGYEVDVVRIGETPEIEDASVVACIDGTLKQRQCAFDALNRTDVVIIQHEYGLYEGPDGDDVIAIANQVTAPKIVVAHTVLADATPGQRSILERLCRSSDVVVVMTETGRRRLIEGFDVDPSAVVVIAHGAATPTPSGQPVTPAGSSRPRLLTWGLLGPGKGIEWAIDAMAQLTDLAPRPHYLVAGATHPKVIADAGEEYREMLLRRATDSGVADMITFDNTYRDLSALNDLIASADLVVLPYDTKEQVTSGVLVDAVAAGRPVVSTAFPHAVELLASGAGVVVPQRDPKALSDAIRSVVEDPARAERMAAEARRLAPSLSWNAVAGQYVSLAAQIVSGRRSVSS